MKFSKGVLVAGIAATAVFGLGGCSTELSPEPFDANLRLTAGQVKMTVQTGKTTQNEVFQALGSPNVIAMESNSGDIWTYDQIQVRRTTQGYSAGANFATIFGFDKLTDGAGNAGVEIGGSVGTSTTSVQSATLIIFFDRNEKVTSYKMLVTSF
ncbi:MAG: hypothetical protein LBM70_07185 [Victivallales bacterium]|jgi:hypothetical protein|nr:hypothetical protein [Victivallales bacterium]